MRQKTFAEEDFERHYKRARRKKISTEPLMPFLFSLLVLLTGVLASVMFCETCKEWVGERLGVYEKSSILQFLGIGMGGVLLALQALMSYKRAKALEDTAQAQAKSASAQACAAQAQAKATTEQAKANQNTEQGQRQERRKNAIEHLGHGNASVRLGGIYELFHLAEDTEELRRRQPMLNFLCAHIRQTTGVAAYRKKNKSRPSEEIQNLLTLLFVQEHEVFKGLHINLGGSWLNGVNLQGARLREARLVGAFLCGAVLGRAHLQGAVLMGAHLQGAILGSAHMQGSFLLGANMQAANLESTRLQGSILDQTELQEANLKDAKLQGIATPKTDIAKKDGISVQFADLVRASIGQESDLSGAIGIEPNSGAIVGAYNVREAKRWIAEHNEAVLKMPESNS